MTELLLNHLGYGSTDIKTLMIQVEEQSNHPEILELHGDQGESIAAYPVPKLSRTKEWHTGYAGSIDFTDFTIPGVYYFSWGELRSRRFQIVETFSKEKLLREMVCYFRRQRCQGEIDQVDLKLSFFGKRRQDLVDVHGGWFDSTTDTSKYLSKFSYTSYMAPQLAPLAVWSLLECSSRLTGSTADLAQQEGLYGADFLVRMCDPKGFFYQMVFDRHSGDLNMRNICNFRGPTICKSENWEASMRQGAGVAIAAIARASQVGVSKEFTPFYYKKTAIRAYKHLKEHNLKYQDDGRDNLLDYYCGLLGATELFRLTKEEEYREDGLKFRKNLLALQVKEGPGRGNWYCQESRQRSFFHHSDHAMPVVALCHSRHLDHWDEEAEEALTAWAEFQITPPEGVNNPFHYPHAWIQNQEHNGTQCLFLPKKNETLFWWIGENGRLGSIAAAYQCILGNDLINGPRKTELKKREKHLVDWLLGCNPFDSSMVEGFGYNNPIFQRDTPNCRGGICHGISTHIDNDLDILIRNMEDDEQSWRWGEQWLNTGAWWLLALS